MKLADIQLTKEQQEFYETQVKELLKHDKVQSMGNYIQHGRINCLEHCIAVANISYKLACFYNWKVDKKSLIRGAMLHDYFLYDWHEKDRRHRLHGFTHPKKALQNALMDFDLNPIEQDIIRKHMWPLTLVLPKYKESVIVNAVDNYCSFFETVYRKRKIYRKYKM